MKCIYCKSKAGLFKRICPDCGKLVAVVRSLPDSFGYRDFLDSLIATGADASKIESFLDTDVDGSGSINDQVTARMTNQIMGSLGQPSHMTSEEVKKVRKDIAEGRAPSQMEGDVTDYSQLKNKT